MLKLYYINFSSVVVVCFSVFVIFCSSQDARASTGTLSASEVLQQIRRDGASTVASRLQNIREKDGRSELMIIETNIESGEELWIKVGKELLKGTDAGNHYSIIVALSRALQHNPQAVLRDFKTDDTLARLCQDNNIEPTPAEHIAFKTRVLAELKKIKGADLNKQKEICEYHINNMK
ncbi:MULTISPECIES: hypothetical protein [unclassified Asaia]|uniref:hypothetical protein n=1 Tax=unclassified Asaia TaxID=2685023 RepID=UPI0003D34B79|nr:hypothetical protein [Asaia sp. SF2.1]ETC99244.1 hypothetical protein P792_04790 [Asaia sp. SF2.1]